MKLADLIAAYRTDVDSPYHANRFRTRTNYDYLCSRIGVHGDMDLSEVNARLIKRWHAEWSEDGTKVSMGHSLVGMLRTVIGFGASMVEDKDCERLCGVLHRMRFKMGKPRQERLSAEQVALVIEWAHRVGFHSIALAQAFQFELMIRQKDVIGEYLPLSEPGESDTVFQGLKWLRGLRWEEIDDRRVIHHVTSKRQKQIDVDLTKAPMVVAELKRMEGSRWGIPNRGPIVINEETGYPYRDHQFRRAWREVADLAGVPPEVFNMDSRAGAISEATDGGAALEDVRHAATHSDIAMTQKYSRNAEEKIARVQNIRAAKRKPKNGT